MKKYFILALISILLVPFSVRANVVLPTRIQFPHSQRNANDSITTDSLPYHRPKVAVVLSGGGAKGTAHISVLREIEKAGIPIDIVVGTSMGSIVGALYACGYTPDYLDSVFRAQEWMPLFLERDNYDEMSYLARHRYSDYVYSKNLSKKDDNSSRSVNAGLIEGKNVMKMFHRFTQAYPDSINFLSDLPLPFACVAVDMKANKEQVFTHGNLDLAMRSSMSIPAVFKPVKKDSMLLVDGGVLNNFPVDVARELGADIVIGSSVIEKGDNEISSVMDIINRLTFTMGEKKLRKNMDDTDIYVDVDIEGYSAASFSHSAIEKILSRGKDAAVSVMDKLTALGNQLGGNEDYLAQRKQYFETQLKPISEQPATFVYEAQQIPPDKIGLKANYNSYELASLLFEGYKTFNTKIPVQLGLSLRLGKRFVGSLGASALIAKSTFLNLNYEYGSYDFKFREDNRKAVNVDFDNHIFRIALLKDWRWAFWGGGFKYHFYSFGKPLVNDFIQTDFTDKLNGKVNYLEAFVTLGIQTTHRRYFPRKGVDILLKGNWYHGKSLTTDGKRNVLAAYASAKVYASANDRLCFIPSVYSRMLNRSSHVYGIFNVVGGPWPGLYVDHQIPFYGIGDIEWYDRLFGSAMFETRYRIGKRHYVSLIGNAAAWGEEFNEMFDETLWGGAINYAYDSFIGPITVTIADSNFGDKVTLIVSIGYVF